MDDLRTTVGIKLAFGSLLYEFCMQDISLNRMKVKIR